MNAQHRETPIKRRYANGKVRWFARYTDSHGRRRSAGTYDRKKEAQDAIDAAYGRVATPETFGEYFETWTSKHPRSKRTNETNEHRIGRVLDRVFHIERTTHEGETIEGTKIDHAAERQGRRAPCPPGLEALIRAIPRRIDTPLLFPTPTGRRWRERNFYRDVWTPTQEASGIDVRPHEMRHSYVTHLRAAGIDDADLADMAGHSIETMLGRYTHPLHSSHEAVRRIIG
jgi:Phage integrase family